MTQAEAAALTAFRQGAKKGSTATVVASLQAGAAELFEKAAKVVREYTGERLCGVSVCNVYLMLLLVVLLVCCVHAHVLVVSKHCGLSLQAKQRTA